MSIPSLIKTLFATLWRGLTRLRLALSNLLFLAVLVLLVVVFTRGGHAPLPPKAALLLDLSGDVVDALAEVDPLQALVGDASRANREIRLRDVLESIRLAAEDPAITALVMKLDHLAYVGISKTQEIAVALDAFRASGKPIIAVGEMYTQDQYLLASHADEVIVYPLGGVALEGYSSYHNYFREALAKASVNVHVFRVGEHKSAVEPFMRDDMSPQEKDVTSRWLGDLWRQYTATVEQHRKLQPGVVDAYINQFAELMKAVDGDLAEAAVQAGLVDRKLGRDDANDYLIEVVGAKNGDGLYEAVPFQRYVNRKRPLTVPGMTAERVAVITAQGSMVPGEQPPGVIGGDSLARLIRDTADAEGVKAIVLRINSGGGSVVAAEVIREQALRLQELGIPLFVSMGAVAASGGYYIAAQADEIWATPTTITGSIGVFAAFPTFEDLLARAGVHTDGVGTTNLAGALRVDRPLNPQLQAALTRGVEFTYRRFLDIVVDGRGLTPEAAERVAGGRVWSAADAKQAGLIDHLGSLDDTIAAAAARAGLKELKVEYVEPPLSARDRLLRQLAERVGSLGLVGRSSTAAVLARVLAPVRLALEEVALLQDPLHLYMRCASCSAVR